MCGPTLYDSTPAYPAHSTLQGMPPAQAGEAGEIAIRAHPFAIIFYGQSRMPCIGHQLAGCRKLGAQLAENRPVPFAGLQQAGLGPPPKLLAEPERAPDRRRRLEDAGVGDHTHKSAQHRFGKAEGPRTGAIAVTNSA